MRTPLSVVLALVVVFAFVAGLQAQKGEVTLKGNITCAKCELKKEKNCTTVIVVKDKKGKEVVYYFDKAAHQKYHKDICKAGKEGTVTGKVSKQKDRNVVTVKKLEYK